MDGHCHSWCLFGDLYTEEVLNCVFQTFLCPRMLCVNSIDGVQKKMFLLKQFIYIYFYLSHRTVQKRAASMKEIWSRCPKSFKLASSAFCVRVKYWGWKAKSKGSTKQANLLFFEASVQMVHWANLLSIVRFVAQANGALNNRAKRSKQATWTLSSSKCQMAMIIVLTETVSIEHTQIFFDKWNLETQNWTKQHQ